MDSIIINGNNATIFWNIRGCHKIEIEGICTLQGNIKGITIKAPDESQIITILFYGFFKRVTKKMKLDITKIQLGKLYHSDFAVPQVVASLYKDVELQCLYTNKNIYSLFSKNISLVMPDLKVQFDNFNSENYKQIPSNL